MPAKEAESDRADFCENLFGNILIRNNTPVYQEADVYMASAF